LNRLSIIQFGTWGKIIIDPATMANNGLEITEIKWLFNVPSDNIDVIVHPESISHSIGKFCDGSAIAQMCPPNMGYPIANYLFSPEIERLEKPSINFAEQGPSHFLGRDIVRSLDMSVIYQCLKLSNKARAFLKQPIK
jgi:1-deoxy-D-xylulose-5-phosphate reductoisomerase